MGRRPLHRRLLDGRPLGRRILRIGYRLASAAAYSWWSIAGSRNRGAKCVLLNDGDVLLVRHTYGDRRTWDFPGGFVRRREDPIVAAGRELGEELGIVAPSLRPIGRLVLRFGRRNDTVHYFAADLPDRRLSPDDVELAEARWFNPASPPARRGEHVAGVLETLTGVDPGGADGRVTPESLASLETDPGSPARG
ncbi:MAG TPA: NUDIX hydrolase [Solirubrobacteraceae bacterium]|nr:NUDIX hydrolase [Solirubrobacteraceae bacterium]